MTSHRLNLNWDFHIDFVIGILIGSLYYYFRKYFLYLRMFIFYRRFFEGIDLLFYHLLSCNRFILYYFKSNLEHFELGLVFNKRLD